MQTNNYNNPITLMRGEREQEQFAAEVNARLGYKATSVFGVARLESREYARRHKTKIATLAPFAQYSGQRVQDLYDAYQFWVESLDEDDLVLIRLPFWHLICNHTAPALLAYNFSSVLRNQVGSSAEQYAAIWPPGWQIATTPGERREEVVVVVVGRAFLLC